MTHALKTWPEYFTQIESGEKKFELRKDDRDFKVGDKLLLQEYVMEEKSYTGNDVERLVTSILRGPIFGLKAGFVIMSIEPYPSSV